MICRLSLSHIHSQLYTLLSLKWGGQGFFPSSCLTCICQIYIVFPWHSIKNVPFQLFSPPQPLVFTCLGGKVAQYGGKKLLTWKGRREHPFYDLSQWIYSVRGKKMNQHYWKQMLTLSVIEDGKSWLSRCSNKGVLMAVRDPVMDHLPICGRTAEAAWNQKWSQSVILTCKRHQR